MNLKSGQNVPSLPLAGRQKRKRPFAESILLTLLGFGLAAISNVLVPQVADVPVKVYQLGAIALNMNQLYRIILIALMVLYLGAGIRSARDPVRKEQYINRSQFRFAMGIVLLLWDVLGTKLQILPQPFFPGPAGILEAFLIEPAYILKNTMYSLRLFLCGFGIGVIVGIGTGILIGWFPRANYWIAPMMKLCGVIPAVAWMPFALTLFPTPFAAAVFLIVITTWFPVASLCAQGISTTPKVQFEAARTLGGSTSYLVFHVAVPHALPNLFTGITTACSFAFITLVMAEMMGQPGGLGYYINTSKVWSAYYKVFAAILIMAVLFSIILKIIEMVKSKVLRWQKGLVK